jgi:hypothetical protein
MLKFSKGTHFTIIGIFAITFVVVYLYYTITDLRKVQADVARLTKQVAAIEKQQVPPPQCAIAPVSKPPTAPASKPSPTPSPVPAPPASVVDDDDSIATEEIKKLLHDASSSDDEEDVHVVQADEEPVESAPREDKADDEPTEEPLAGTGAPPSEHNDDDIQLAPAKPKSARGRKSKQQQK